MSTIGGPVVEIFTIWEEEAGYLKNIQMSMKTLKRHTEWTLIL